MDARRKKSPETPPEAVPARATRAGEIRSAGTGPNRDLDRPPMLAALETGVKGGYWFSLIDKVYPESNLWSAWSKAAENNGAAGVDHVRSRCSRRSLGSEPEDLSEDLRSS